MRRLFTLWLLMVSATQVFGQSKRPFTFEDMMALKRVGAPVVSPDGKWVVFSVMDVSLEANTKSSHIWIVPAAGGAERGLIIDQDADRPRWSPDGKRFAFVSTREGGSQIWIADFDGAAGAVTGVHKLTSIATQAGGELWSPDGNNILFTSDVYPECDGAPEAEAACNARKLDEAAKSKVKALVFEHLLYRHWNAYKEGRRSHIFVVTLSDTRVSNLAQNCSSLPVTLAVLLGRGAQMEPMQRGFRRFPSVRGLLAAISDWLKRSLGGLRPRSNDLASPRMCPFCGLITPRHKASCLECGHALEKIPVG